MSRNSTVGVLADCTDLNLSRVSFAGICRPSSLLSIENETMLTNNTDMSASQVIGNKSFLERVNSLDVATLFPRGSLNHKRPKRKKNAKGSSSTSDSLQSTLSSNEAGDSMDGEKEDPNTASSSHSINGLENESLVESNSESLEILSVNSKKPTRGKSKKVNVSLDATCEKIDNSVKEDTSVDELENRIKITRAFKFRSNKSNLSKSNISLEDDDENEATSQDMPSMSIQNSQKNEEENDSLSDGNFVPAEILNVDSFKDIKTLKGRKLRKTIASQRISVRFSPCSSLDMSRNNEATQVEMSNSKQDFKNSTEVNMDGCENILINEPSCTKNDDEDSQTGSTIKIKQKIFKNGIASRKVSVHFDCDSLTLNESQMSCQETSRLPDSVANVENSFNKNLSIVANQTDGNKSPQRKTIRRNKASQKVSNKIGSNDSLLAKDNGTNTPANVVLPSEGNQETIDESKSKNTISDTDEKDPVDNKLAKEKKEGESGLGSLNESSSNVSGLSKEISNEMDVITADDNEINLNSLGEPSFEGESSTPNLEVIIQKKQSEPSALQAGLATSLDTSEKHEAHGGTPKLSELLESNSSSLNETEHGDNLMDKIKKTLAQRVSSDADLSKTNEGKNRSNVYKESEETFEPQMDIEEKNELLTEEKESKINDSCEVEDLLISQPDIDDSKSMCKKFKINSKARKVSVKFRSNKSNLSKSIISLEDDDENEATSQDMPSMSIQNSQKKPDKNEEENYSLSDSNIVPAEILNVGSFKDIKTLKGRKLRKTIASQRISVRFSPCSSLDMSRNNEATQVEMSNSKQDFENSSEVNMDRCENILINEPSCTKNDDEDNQTGSTIKSKQKIFKNGIASRKVSVHFDCDSITLNESKMSSQESSRLPDSVANVDNSCNENLSIVANETDIKESPLRNYEANQVEMSDSKEDFEHSKGVNMDGCENILINEPSCTKNDDEDNQTGSTIKILESNSSSLNETGHGDNLMDKIKKTLAQRVSSDADLSKTNEGKNRSNVYEESEETFEPQMAIEEKNELLTEEKESKINDSCEVEDLLISQPDIDDSKSMCKKFKINSKARKVSVKFRSNKSNLSKSIISLEDDDENEATSQDIPSMSIQNSEKKPDKNEEENDSLSDGNIVPAEILNVDSFKDIKTLKGRKLRKTIASQRISVRFSPCSSLDMSRNNEATQVEMSNSKQDFENSSEVNMDRCENILINEPSCTKNDDEDSQTGSTIKIKKKIFKNGIASRKVSVHFDCDSITLNESKMSSQESSRLPDSVANVYNSCNENLSIVANETDIKESPLRNYEANQVVMSDSKEDFEHSNGVNMDGCENILINEPSCTKNDDEENQTGSTIKILESNSSSLNETGHGDNLMDKIKKTLAQRVSSDADLSKTNEDKNRSNVYEESEETFEPQMAIEEKNELLTEEKESKINDSCEVEDLLISQPDVDDSKSMCKKFKINSKARKVSVKFRSNKSNLSKSIISLEDDDENEATSQDMPSMSIQNSEKKPDKNEEENDSLSDGNIVPAEILNVDSFKDIKTLKGRKLRKTIASQRISVRFSPCSSLDMSRNNEASQESSRLPDSVANVDNSCNENLSIVANETDSNENAQRKTIRRNIASQKVSIKIGSDDSLMPNDNGTIIPSERNQETIAQSESNNTISDTNEKDIDNNRLFNEKRKGESGLCSLNQNRSNLFPSSKENSVEMNVITVHDNETSSNNKCEPALEGEALTPNLEVIIQKKQSAPNALQSGLVTSLDSSEKNEDHGATPKPSELLGGKLDIQEVSTVLNKEKVTQINQNSTCSQQRELASTNVSIKFGSDVSLLAKDNANNIQENVFILSETNRVASLKRDSEDNIPGINKKDSVNSTLVPEKKENESGLGSLNQDSSDVSCLSKETSVEMDAMIAHNNEISLNNSGELSFKGESSTNTLDIIKKKKQAELRDIESDIATSLKTSEKNEKDNEGTAKLSKLLGNVEILNNEKETQIVMYPNVSTPFISDISQLPCNTMNSQNEFKSRCDNFLKNKESESGVCYSSQNTSEVISPVASDCNTQTNEVASCVNYVAINTDLNKTDKTSLNGPLPSSLVTETGTIEKNNFVSSGSDTLLESQDKDTSNKQSYPPHVPKETEQLELSNHPLSTYKDDELLDKEQENEINKSYKILDNMDTDCKQGSESKRKRAEKVQNVSCHSEVHNSQLRMSDINLEDKNEKINQSTSSPKISNTTTNTGPNNEKGTNITSSGGSVISAQTSTDDSFTDGKIQSNKIKKTFTGDISNNRRVTRSSKSSSYLGSTTDFIEDISIIPNPKSGSRKVYHSTPINPTIRIASNKRKISTEKSRKMSTDKSRKMSTSKSRISLKGPVQLDDKMIQVSKTIFGSSTEATSVATLSKKKSMDLSSSFNQAEKSVSRTKRKSDEVDSKSKRLKEMESSGKSRSYHSNFLSTFDDESIYYETRRSEKKVAFKGVTSYDNNSETDYRSGDSSYSIARNRKSVGFREVISLIDDSSDGDIRDTANFDSPTIVNRDSFQSEVVRDHADVGEYSRSRMEKNEISLNYTAEIPEIILTENEIEVEESCAVSEECSLFKEVKKVSEFRMPVPKKHKRKKEERPMLTGNKKNVRHNIKNDPRYSISHFQVPEEVTFERWVSPNLIKFLSKKLMNDDNLDYVLQTERVVSVLCSAVNAVKNLHNVDDIELALLPLKNLLVNYNICSNQIEYCTFISRYTPFEFQCKSLPLGGYYRSINRQSEKILTAPFLTETENVNCL